MDELDTIIVGAGVSGLGCARTLLKQDPLHKFLVLTEDVGGRITTSMDGNINYGAYFVMDDKHYRYISRIVEINKRLNPFRVAFHDKNKKSYSILHSMRHPMQVWRLIRILFNFKNEYLDYMRDCEVIGQKEALEKNPKLKNYYCQTARDYVLQNKISDVANDILSEIVYAFSFVSLDEISTLDMLRISMVLIVPTHKFTLNRSKATENFKEKIQLDSVISFKKNKGKYEVTTRSGAIYYSRNLVIATPPHVTVKFIKSLIIKDPTSAFITHFKGSMKKNYPFSGYDFNVFDPTSDLIAIAKENDGTFQFLSREGTVKPEDFFENVEVITKYHWNPAFNLKVSNILHEADRGEGLYIIGDYNMTGLEDSYITGVYAGNRIIERG